VYPATLKGDVREARFGERALHVGRMRAADSLKDRWLSEGITLSATVQLEEVRTRLASAVSVLNGDREEVALLGVRGHAAVFRLRTRAADLTLRTPLVRLADAIPEDLGPVALRGTLHEGILQLRGDDARGAKASVVPLTAGLGWFLLSPFELTLSERSGGFTALWSFVGTLLIGWYGARAARRSSVLWPATILVVVGLAAPSRRDLAAWPAFLEFGASCAGVAVGWWISLAVAHGAVAPSRSD
jgi:hypothetical protein